MKCTGCGCTDEHACIGIDGVPCYWASKQPPLCSTCADMAIIATVVKVLRDDARVMERDHRVPVDTRKKAAKGKRWLARRLQMIVRKIGHGASR